MATEELFNTPSQVAAGDFIRLGDLDGCLIVLRAVSPDEVTAQFDNGEGTYVEGQVLVVEGAEELSGEWHDLWVFPVAVRGQIKRSYPKPVVGVLGHGEAQKGKSAPWILQEPDAKQQKAAREAFVKAEAGF